MTAPEFLYRYQEALWVDDRLTLVLYRFPVVKRTRCGAQIDVWGRRRFVNLNARKRYACLTEAEALESYHARKRRQIGILRHRLAQAEAAFLLKQDGERIYIDTNLHDLEALV